MKKLFLTFAAAGLLLTGCVKNPEGEKAEVTDSIEATSEASGAGYAINTEESVLRWEGRKVTATHHGTVNFKSGVLYIDGDNLTGGSFVADMGSIVNEDQEGEWNDRLVGHLKSDDFFHIEEHPEAMFEITEVKAGENDQLVISGNLTIRGISKNITFNADVIEINSDKAQLAADFNIEREDWGINYTGAADDLIAKEINFKINLVANNG